MSLSNKLCFTVHATLFHCRYKGYIVIGMFFLHEFIQTTYKALVHILIIYTQKPPSNGHAGLSIGARAIICGPNPHLHPYSMYVTNSG